MKHTFIGATLGLSAVLTAPAAFSCTPIDQMINAVLSQSPGLSLAETNLSLAKNERKLIRSNWRPQISAIGRTTGGDSQFSQAQVDNSVGLRVTQRLYDFGRSGLEKQAADFLKLEAEERFYAARNDEAFQVTVAYIDILEADKTLNIMQERATYLEELVTKFDFSLSEGASTVFELAEAQTELATTNAEIANVIAFQQASKADISVRYPEFSGVCPSSSVDRWLGGKANSDDLNRLDVEDVSNSPLYRAETLKYQALKVEQRLSKRARLPVIQAVGTSLYGYDDLNQGWGLRNQFGLEVTVPLMTGGRLSVESDSARLTAQSANFRSEETARSLRLDILSTGARITALKREKVAREAALSAALRQFEAGSKEYELSSRTFSDLVEVLLDRDRADLSLTKVRFEIMRQTIRLLSLRNQIVDSSNDFITQASFK